jgi:hypothetical protein
MTAAHPAASSLPAKYQFFLLCEALHNRKNWLFVGSEDAGEWAAIFYSIVESCRMCGIDPRRYFAHVTPRLVGPEPPEPALLTPAALRDTLLSK